MLETFYFQKKLLYLLLLENIKIVEKEKQELLKREEEIRNLAIAEKEKYENYVLSMDVNIKEDKVIYGSINLQNVLDKLKSDGFNLEKKQVNLPRGPIRTLADDHIITVTLHSDVQVTIPIKLNVVEAEDSQDNLASDLLE